MSWFDAEERVLQFLKLLLADEDKEEMKRLLIEFMQEVFEEGQEDQKDTYLQAKRVLDGERD